VCGNNEISVLSWDYDVPDEYVVENEKMIEAHKDLYRIVDVTGSGFVLASDT